MKVLHLLKLTPGHRFNGGAAKGAYQLHLGLKQAGVESKILVDSRAYLGDSDIICLPQTLFGIILKAIKARLYSLVTKRYSRSPEAIYSSSIVGADFTKAKEYKEADIIHLHWINGFVDMKTLSKIKKPIVWTMRDMFPMTGGCHYSFACKNYQIGCGNCPQLMSKHKYDPSRYVVYRKKKYLPKDIQMIGISTWITKEAQQSDVFRGADVRTISNAVDISKFYPLDTASAKNLLQIQTHKKIILTGSGSYSMKYKGFEKYLEAINMLDRSKYYLCFFGNITDETPIKNLGFEYTSFGYVADDRLLNFIYNIADVFVAPSIMEAFGKTLVEAMACKTPVVCFDYSGPRDIVDHKINGYRAKPFEAQDLAEGIEWVLNEKDYTKLCESARDKAKKFDNVLIAQEYAELYRDMLQADKHLLATAASNEDKP